MFKGPAGHFALRNFNASPQREALGVVSCAWAQSINRYRGRNEARPTSTTKFVLREKVDRGRSIVGVRDDGDGGGASGRRTTFGHQ